MAAHRKNVLNRRNSAHDRRMPAGIAMTAASPMHTAAPATDSGGAPSARQRRWPRLRFRFRPRPAALPLVLLLLALSTLFLFSGDREYFYRDQGGDGDHHHDWNSSQTLTFAENLSFRHNLLVFHYQSRDAAGNLQYPSVYNRFPLGGYVLVKLAIFPFGDTDFRAKIYAGRMLMLLLFSAAAVLAYAALARITGSRWDALTATLLAFSSYYVLYYADKISNEVTIDLFAAMLAFHGMVIFVQEGRFRQLVIKSCLALLLGWHVYAFLLPFIAFGLAAELLKARRFYPSPVLCNPKRCGVTLLRSRYLLLGIVTLLFGIAVLSFNFSNEYFSRNGEVPFRELPSVASAVLRLGGDEHYNVSRAHQLVPQVFWSGQFYRIGVATLPYALNPYEIKGLLPRSFGRYHPELIAEPIITCGVLALGVCLAGLVGIRRHPGQVLLLATLAISGFCWAVPVRYNVVSHDFESVFYIGIPLTAFALTLLWLRRRFRVRLSPYLAVAALAVFAASASAMAGVGESRAQLAVEAEAMAEYAAIRKLADDNAVIYIPWRPERIRSGGAAYASQYFLAGKTLSYQYAGKPERLDGRQKPDYLLLPIREENESLMTPENRQVFLYDYALYEDLYDEADLGRRIIAADWNVYLRDDRLIYASSECANRDAVFWLHFVPADAAVLPAARQEIGYDNADFEFRKRHRKYWLNGRCVIARPLPEYDIIAIRTGQYNAAGRIWEGEYRLPAR